MHFRAEQHESKDKDIEDFLTEFLPFEQVV